jgi:hypothetical protein
MNEGYSRAVQTFIVYVVASISSMASWKIFMNPGSFSSLLNSFS